MNEKTATQVMLDEHPAPVSYLQLIATRRAHQNLVDALIERMKWRSPQVVQPSGMWAIVDLTMHEKSLLELSGTNLARAEYAYRYWQKIKFDNNIRLDESEEHGKFDDLKRIGL